ncbi:MAG: hypothetical protein TREMPRED_002280 [Tremellales sp. Tagirdzhanova-0007]|nr:MAG: hypothetical protein TREMPRED_002280 [Tremellales sp. Tagirdzhanova-0007]
MSHKPIAAMSGFSLLGGISAFTRYNSLPSLVASFGIGGIMALSSMRIRDGMEYGLEAAAASSALLMVPTLRRAVMTRAPIPISLALLATASTGYYVREFVDRHP